jgi:L,D-transpeptidase catalytic domain
VLRKEFATYRQAFPLLPHLRLFLDPKAPGFGRLIDNANQGVEFVMRRDAIILAAALSLFIGIDSAEAKLEILVEKASQRMVVIQDGYMRYIWPVSTGRDELATPNGTYTPQRLERSWFSSEYYSSPMPNSIFFHNGYAIHGSSAINQLGGPASHGCVRLHPHHAALLFDLVQQEGRENTTIEVTDEPQPDMLRPRDSEQAREMSSAAPKLERSGDVGDMAELSGGQRAIRPATARAPLPSRPPPANRRQLTNLIAAVNAPRGPCGTRADTTDCRTRPKSAEGALRERAEAAQPPTSARLEQQAQSVYGFKVLPSSCWSGGASRWRWWRTGQDVPCK